MTTTASDEMLTAAIPFVQVIATEFEASDFPAAQGMALDILAEAVGYDFEEVKATLEATGMVPVGFAMRGLQLLAILAFRCAAVAEFLCNEDDYDEQDEIPAELALSMMRIIFEPADGVDL